MTEIRIERENPKSATLLEKVLPGALEGKLNLMSLVGYALDQVSTPEAWARTSKQLDHDLPIPGLQKYLASKDEAGNLLTIDFINDNSTLSCKPGGISWDCSWNKQL